MTVSSMSNSSPSTGNCWCVCHRMSKLGQLPWYDIIFPRIFNKLHYRDLFKLRRVCRSFYQLVDAYFAYTTTIDLSVTLLTQNEAKICSSTMTDKNDKMFMITRTGNYCASKCDDEITQQDDPDKYKKVYSKCCNSNNSSNNDSLMAPEVAYNQSNSTWYTRMDQIDEDITCLSNNFNSLTCTTSKFNSTSLAVILYRKQLHSTYRCCKHLLHQQASASSLQCEQRDNDTRDHLFIDHQQKFRAYDEASSSNIFSISQHIPVVSGGNYSSNFHSQSKVEETNNSFIDTCNCDICLRRINCTQYKSYQETKDDHLNSNSRKTNICYDDDEEEEENEEVESETGQLRIKGETIFYDSPEKTNQMNRDVNFVATSHSNQLKLLDLNDSYASTKQRKKDDDNNEAINEQSSKNYSTADDDLCDTCKMKKVKVSHKLPDQREIHQIITNNLFNQSYTIVNGIKCLNLASCDWLTDDDLYRVINCCSLQPSLESLDLSACYRVSNLFEMLNSLSSWSS